MDRLNAGLEFENGRLSHMRSVQHLANQIPGDNPLD